MAFKPLNFRCITTLDFKIRTADSTSLILIQSSGYARYARTRTDKDCIITDYRPADLLLWVWPGKYHTDIFQLDQTDIDRWYK